MKRRVVTILWILSAILLIPNFIDYKFPEDIALRKGDTYNSELKMNSIDDILDSAGLNKGPITDTLAFFEKVDTLIEQQFYHGIAEYSLRENWIAAMGGLFWDHISGVSHPDEIMNNRYGSCLQQSFVQMECARRMKVPFRALLFYNHFTSELFIGGKWYLFDADLEPVFAGKRKSYADVVAARELPILYAGKDAVNPEPDYYAINQFTIQKISLLHRITYWLSRLLWLLPLSLAIYLTKRGK